jgi:hypothetical protein
MKSDPRRLWVPALLFASAAALWARLIWPEESKKASVVAGALIMLFFIFRLAALSVRAFIQGINEGDDPRRANRTADRP